MAINAMGMGVIWQPVNWVWMHYGNQCIGYACTMAISAYSLGEIWQSVPNI